jgi:hypothetical protein
MSLATRKQSQGPVEKVNFPSSDMDITSWIIFTCLKYISLALDLISSIILKILTNIEEFEFVEYICDQIILITKFEILNMYLKNNVVDGILG